MSRPGVDVSLLDAPGTISGVSNTGVWFVVGQTERGPTVPVFVTSLDDLVAKLGNRVSYSVLYDSLEVFFREGGALACVSRVVGPAATTGSVNLMDNAAAISLVAAANGPGAWSNQYKVGVSAGSASGTYAVRVYDVNNVLLEDSGDLPDQGSAVAWSAYSNYIRITPGVSLLNPAPAASVLIPAGADDRANITDAQYQTALDKFTTDLGPGQVSEPGRSTTTAFAQLTGHAETRNRVALLDMPNVATVATLIGVTAKSRFAAKFAPWVIVPGITLGTIRTVPPSALVAGLIAKNDPSVGVNRPSAGNAGESLFATDLSQPSWIDSDRQTLNAAGVNVIRRFNGIQVYGWRSAADPVADVNWLPFNNSRLFMMLVDELNDAAANYMFYEIDGVNGNTVNGLRSSLIGVMMGHYQLGELFGDSPPECFTVDTGHTVNTPASIQRLELHANVYVRMAPFVEWIKILISKRPVTETL